MNSDDVVTNRENMVHDHVLEVVLEERSFLV
jgi:hypothetical protein